MLLLRYIFLSLVFLSSTSVSGQTADNACEQGRFQLFVNPNIRADTFKIDTKTGEIWRLVVTKDGEGVWEPMRQLN